MRRFNACVSEIETRLEIQSRQQESPRRAQPNSPRVLCCDCEKLHLQFVIRWHVRNGPPPCSTNSWTDGSTSGRYSKGRDAQVWALHMTESRSGFNRLDCRSNPRIRQDQPNHLLMYKDRSQDIPNPHRRALELISTARPIHSLSLPSNHGKSFTTTRHTALSSQIAIKLVLYVHIRGSFAWSPSG